jgi:hypothetical protein
VTERLYFFHNHLPYRYYTTMRLRKYLLLSKPRHSNTRTHAHTHTQAVITEFFIFLVNAVLHDAQSLQNERFDCSALPCSLISPKCYICNWINYYDPEATPTFPVGGRYVFPTGCWTHLHREQYWLHRALFALLRFATIVYCEMDVLFPQSRAKIST